MSTSGFSLLKAIIKPLRDNDDTKLLERYLQGPQAIHDQAEATILSLADQLKADKIREDLLQYLMPLVGFTSELRNITDRLTTTQLRRLVALAVPLWDQRHTRAGLVNAIRLLTGRASVFSDWFFYRAVLSETHLLEDMLASGDFWVIGGTVSRYDEYVSNIRVMDDGTLDELLLLDVCKLMRPLDERFEIFIDDFLDQFDLVLDKWTNLDGNSVASQGAIDAVTYPNTLKLVPGGNLTPVIPILPMQTSHHDYNIVCKFNIPATGILVVRWYTALTSAGTAYELTLDAATGRGTLRRWDAGVSTVIQAAALWPAGLVFSPGVWYSLRISTVNVNATTRALRILIDGAQAVPATGTELIDVPGITPGFGYYLFKSAGATPVWIDNVESWRNPARFATIGLSTISERGGAVTMTSNFVQ